MIPSTSLATSTSTKRRRSSATVVSATMPSILDMRRFPHGLAATFLVADGMTFAGFFAAYLTFRAVNPLPAGSTYELELLLPVDQHRAAAGEQLHLPPLGTQPAAGPQRTCRAWLLLTAALGAAFLAGQMVEYFSLPFGLTDNLFASTFYALTGFHGLHVTLGVICILLVWFRPARGVGSAARTLRPRGCRALLAFRRWDLGDPLRILYVL